MAGHTRIAVEKTREAGAMPASCAFSVRKFQVELSAFDGGLEADDSPAAPEEEAEPFPLDEVVVVDEEAAGEETLPDPPDFL